MKICNFDLPEFVFLDELSHHKSLTEDRILIQHNPTHTIIEASFIDDLLFLPIESDITRFDFIYHNVVGKKETFRLKLYMTFAEDNEIKNILLKSAMWYSDYMTWSDKNSMNGFG